ncbi:telomere-binding alpha subunit central domain-containing [Trichoderma cornu-damae]|uniref:Protection of telomeres protein 1 n=1 Tax=Trichoderma cornu-damae TaxID=654480 RepID=A0A9P8U0Y4_9HYPO|nr:telomere-binding alpha subunit central domain-containing [Trichoderma cornu-damae]
MAPTVNKGQKPLPSGFISVREILDHKRGVGKFLNVIGVVKDFRTPAPTRGSDWKSEIRLYDGSVEDATSDSLAINIFRPENEMPNPSLGDVIVLFQAKLQLHTKTLSLVTHWTTDIYLYSASQIPRPPDGAEKALRPPPRKTTHTPGQSVHEYVSILYHSIDKSVIPTEAEFQDTKAKLLSGAGRFKELKDVRDGTFVDVVVQLVKNPYDSGDRITLWVSDFTENDGFFHFAFKGHGAPGDQAAGPDGYLATSPFGAGAGAGGEWQGPFGKRSMQVTCFDPHTTFIREWGLSTGSWVMLRNLQIKYGRNATNLEGFLREDRGSSSLKINIIRMDPTNRESSDPRLMEAVQRHHAYHREKQHQLHDIFFAEMAGKKRKIAMAEMGFVQGDKPKKKNKNKSKAKKKAMNQEESTVASTAYSEGLTRLVKCEYESKAISNIEDILDPVYIQTDVNGKQVKLRLPFVNVNYRAFVRVVNFTPPNLEDFARPKKAAKHEIVSGNEGSEADFDTEGEGASLADRATAREWEWRFFLELEDANPPKDDQEGRKTLWVAVNNLSAQCLTNLDASDLRQDQKKLEVLRQRLFLLWGELEEKKSVEEEENRRRAALANREAIRPPLHSSDDESSSMPQRSDAQSSQVSNRPFTCCIHQYGVQVPEGDPHKADAGEGKRWQRMFGLFGTRIAHN